jgi:hypothetical protein
MTLLALGAGIFFALAMILRELQLGRERAMHQATFEQLHLSLEGVRAQLRRAGEDLYVLQAVLAERNLLNEADLARGRARLIENPRRIAEERDAIQRHLGVAPTHLVVDDSDGKIH